MREFIKENLKKMVKIDSHSKGNMDEIIEFTSNLLEEIGLEPRIIKGEHFNPVIIASNGEGGVCFSGHLDTVPLGEGWEYEQGEIIDDKLYGRGSLDMKGPCMSAIAAAKELKKEDFPFSLVFSTDEEITMAGAEEIINKTEITEAPAVVVCEPTDMLVVTEEKGVFQFEIKTKGKNAHASMPEKGENAIVKMLPILQSISNKNNVPATKDQMTCNVDIIEGGNATNVIPDVCRAEVDVRFPPQFNREILEKYIFDPIDGDYEFKELHWLDAVKLSTDSECVKKMLDITDTSTWAVPYGTEMVRFFKTNESTLICGPGKVDMAHKPNEFIEIPDLLDAVEIYVQYAKEMV